MVCPNYDWIRLIFEKDGRAYPHAQGACMKRLIGFTAALCLLAVMVGCGGVSSTGTLAYISNSSGSGFTVYTVNTDGTLTRSSISPLSTPQAPLVLKFTPNSKWAYFLDATGSYLYGYTRSGNGSLGTEVDTPIPVGPGAQSLVVSSNSNFVYVAEPTQQYLAIFSIDQSTGILTQVGSNLNVGYDIEQLVLSPSGTYLYGLSTNKAAILTFTLTASTGVATLTNTYPVGTKPSYLVLSSNGNYAYVLDSKSVYCVGGATTCTTSSPVNTTTSPNIFGFTVSGGTFTAMPDSPFTENADALSGAYPTVPRGGATTSDNRYLFVANTGSQNISAFQISSTTGELTEVLGSTTTVNGTTTSTASPFSCSANSCKSPTFVAIPGGNNALFVTDPDTNKIYQFQIDQNYGRLRPQSPVSVGAEGTPTWITIR
jgi:6-phosphogluconolactonase (cycloisomerase 2 family)